MESVSVVKLEMALLQFCCGRVASLLLPVAAASSKCGLVSSICRRPVADRVQAMAADDVGDRDESDAVVDVTVDAAVVAAAARGDGDAFRQIVETHQNTIAVQMRRFSRDPQVVDELTHDVFVEAYSSLTSWRGKSPLIHWLRRIAVRVGFRYWKRRTKRDEQTIPLSQVADSVEQFSAGIRVEPNVAGEILADLLSLLSPRDRLVLTLLYWEGCTVDEAAELAGWSRTMVKVQAHRARNRLRKLIEEFHQ